MLTVSVTTLRTGVLTEAEGGSIDGMQSKDEAVGGVARGGGAAAGRIGRAGGRIGAGGGVRGRFPGPDLAAGAFRVGVLVSELGTTLLITLWMEKLA